mmetsp:Transcript_19266/g.55924  ORF Transcript_19266/g.55924 Transcript_19266/m.55924 type:complete len:208 (+) Transcript_19266:875-1498(+)
MMWTCASRYVASASAFLSLSELKSCTASVAAFTALSMSILEQCAPASATEAMASPRRLPEFLQMFRASVACLRASRFSFIARLALLCVTRIMAISSWPPTSFSSATAACAAWWALPYASSARWMLATVCSMPASHFLSSDVRSFCSRMKVRPRSAVFRASTRSSFARSTATFASQAAASPFLSCFRWKRESLSLARRPAAPFSPSAR